MSSLWLALIFKLLMGVLIGILAMVLASKLPEAIRPSVQSKVKKDFVKSGPHSQMLATAMAMICSHYISSVAAIFGIGVAILIEIWKLVDYFGTIASAVLVVAGVIGIAAVARMRRVDWLDQTEEAYKKGLGKRFDRAGWVLWIILMVVSAVGPIMEITRPSRDSVVEVRAMKSTS